MSKNIACSLLFVVLLASAETTIAGMLLRVDFNNTPANLQSGFTEQGAVDALYSVGGGTVNVDVPAGATISNRTFNSLLSSDSDFIADGTEIGDIAIDFLFRGAANAALDITLADYGPGTYTFNGWFSDVLQGPGAVVQRIELSTNGGSSFSLIDGAIDPSGLNASPFAFSFSANGLQDVIIRVQENNINNQLRLNAFAISFVVPEPSTAMLFGLGIVGLVSRRRRTK